MRIRFDKSKWVKGKLFSVIYEVREDEEGDYCHIEYFLDKSTGILTGSYNKYHSKRIGRPASSPSSWWAILSVLRGWENCFQKTRMFFGMSGSRNNFEANNIFPNVPPQSWKRQQEKWVVSHKTRYHFTLVKLRNSAEMDQEVYQRVLDFCSENEEEEGKTRNA